MPRSKKPPQKPSDQPASEQTPVPSSSHEVAQGSTETSIASLATRNKAGQYRREDFSVLADNEHFRYAPNSRRVGHAVIVPKKDGDPVALQYQLPGGVKADDPEVCPLTDIEEIVRFGMTRHRAKGPDGKRWYARRYDHARVKTQDDDDAQSVDLAYFSEEETPDKEPFWGSKNEVPRFKKDLDEETRKDFEKESAEIGQISKGGHDMEIDPESVRRRDADPTRKPDQNTVMGQSARDAYEDYFSEMEDQLSPELVTILQRAFKANIRKSPENQYRPEWLHLYGFSLFPMSQDPQKEQNLGAAGKWANTEMMVLERVAKWFSLNRGNETQIKIKALFKMLRGSELVDKIHFEVNLETKNRMLTLIKDLDAFKKWPIFRKASDLAQAAGISHAILTETQPVSSQSIKRVGMQPRVLPSIKATGGADAPKAVSSVEALAVDIPKAFAPRKQAFTAAPSPVVAKVVAAPKATVAESTAIVIETAQAPASLPKTAVVATTHAAPVAKLVTDTAESSLKPVSKRTFLSGGTAMPKSKSTFPTSIADELSIVQVLVTSHEADYDEPWNGTHIVGSSGTGLVVEHNGEKFILTNAHCVENQIRTQIRLTNDRERKFEAVPIVVAYQCDLALLKVKSTVFQQLAKPVVLGDMVTLRDKVTTIGFPMGGDEVSVTEGIVSRIEVRDYVMSGLDMLQVQVDAAINPGNSGGPVFSDGKVVGVAFQGYNSAQSLGYMIPMPIVRHFLKEVFNGKPYRGFPILSMELECLQNKTQRRYFGLVKGQTGIRVNQVDPLCDAHAKLKKDDIILEIEGHKISADGTVDIPEIGNCIDMLHITHSKFIGDSVRLKLLRKNAAGTPEVMELDVILDKVPYDTNVVPQTEHDKMPTYYINSGFVFVPVSRNFLEGPGSELDEMTILDPEHGTYRIGEMPKKEDNQQFVAINTVLDCRTTEGYGKFERELVKKVNGKAIKNFADLIQALESNQGDTHIIEVAGGRIIALKKLNEAELNRVMRDHKISYDRSEDLRPRPALAAVPQSTEDSSDDEAEVAPPKNKEQAATAMEIEEEQPVKVTKKRRIIEEESEEEEDEDEIELGSQDSEDDEEETASEEESASEEEEVEVSPREKRKAREQAAAAELLGKDGMMPGQRRFMATLDRMEKRALKEQAADDEDDVVDWDNLTDKDDESDEDYVPPRRSTRSTAAKQLSGPGAVKSSFFASKRPREDDDEDAPSNKRRRTKAPAL
jgi:large subunit ribosomal protein L28